MYLKKISVKKFVFIIFILINCIQFSYSQDTIRKTKFYHTWINTKKDSIKFQGILYELQDSSILVANSLIVKNYPLGDYKVTKIYISEIDKIKARRTKSVGRGILIGSITGIAVGGIIGLASGDDPTDTWFAMTAGEKALVSGIFVGGIGAVTGLIIGSIRVKFTINGNIQDYNRQKKKMRKYSVRYYNQ